MFLISHEAAAITRMVHPNRDTLNCYVVFVSPSSALHALEQDNFVFEGKHLRVTLAGSLVKVLSCALLHAF